MIYPTVPHENYLKVNPSHIQISIGSSKLSTIGSLLCRAKESDIGTNKSKLVTLSVVLKKQAELLFDLRH
jgi:hypothetical protein